MSIEIKIEIVIAAVTIAMSGFTVNVIGIAVIESSYIANIRAFLVNRKVVDFKSKQADCLYHRVSNIR